MHIFWTRLASFCHLGFISDLLIVSKFHNKTHDPKGKRKENLHYSEGQGDVLPCSNYTSGSQKLLAQMSHVLFVEVLHPVNFVNITDVKS